MRDTLIIFALCLVAIIIGAWLFFYAPPSLVVFPHQMPLAAESATGTSHPAQVAAVEVVFADIASGTDSKAVHGKNYAIAAKNDFADVWSVISKESPPDVDFASKNVIAVFAGQQPSGGYTVKVEKITDMPDKRVVSIVLTQPGKNCATTESVTSPFDIIEAPASALMPVREERVVTADCK